MAVKPATDVAFLREVDEELRRDQLAGAWRRWGRLAVVAVVAALALFAGVLWWGHHREQQAGVQGEQLSAALDQLSSGQEKQAAPTLAALAESSRDGYRALAMLAQADTLANARDDRAAVAKYAAIAADGGVAQPFRDLATLRQTTLAFDTLTPQAVVERLRPLATPANAWFGSAGELTAIAYLRQNRRDLAGRLFGQIARAQDVPESIRQRSVQMASLMGVDAAPASTPNSLPAGVIPKP